MPDHSNPHGDIFLSDITFACMTLLLLISILNSHVYLVACPAIYTARLSTSISLCTCFECFVVFWWGDRVAGIQVGIVSQHHIEALKEHLDQSSVEYLLEKVYCTQLPVVAIVAHSL